MHFKEQNETNNRLQSINMKRRKTSKTASIQYVTNLFYWTNVLNFYISQCIYWTSMQVVLFLKYFVKYVLDLCFRLYFSNVSHRF